ncbi:hypothetical protein Btru_069264 [Bulinus truncatus]|nr:hypothetical protein Btru_069264 [Bulinus truncatus]
MAAYSPQKSSLTRSHSMKLTTSSRPGLTSTSTGPIRSSASWSAINGQSFRQLEPLTGRPISSRLTPNNNILGAEKQDKSAMPARHSGKQVTSAVNRNTDQRLTGGETPTSSAGPLQRRMSLDTTPLSQLPGNRPRDTSELKSILKHPRRSLSISYGEMAAKTARASRSAFSSSSAFSSALLLTTSSSFNSTQSPDDGEGPASDEALLRNCQYRLGPTLSSATDYVQKKEPNNTFICTPGAAPGINSQLCECKHDIMSDRLALMESHNKTRRLVKLVNSPPDFTSAELRFQPMKTGLACGVVVITDAFWDRCHMAAHEVISDPALNGLVGLTMTTSRPEERRPRADSDPAFGHVHGERHTPGSLGHSQNELVVQMYSHIKHCQKVNQQRKSKLDRAERSRRKKNTLLTSPTFTVDLSSGRWLRGDLNSTSRSCNPKAPEQDRSADITTAAHPQGKRSGSDNVDADSLLASGDARLGRAVEYSNHSLGRRLRPDDARDCRMDRDRSADSRSNVRGTESTRSLGKTARGQVHWNSVQPGGLTPAKVTIVTIDGRKFV